MWQADFVAQKLASLTSRPIEIRKIKTTGDKILDAPLAKIGDKGLFVKEIEVSLSQEQIDLAVHSTKDLPTQLPPDLTIGAILKRQDPRDALISRDGSSLSELRQGAVLGTSSLRRKAQLLNFRPDFMFTDVRGNLNTRLTKMREGQFDGMILASAGLDRMGWADQITERIREEVCLPAVGQGAIAVEIRAGDSEVAAMVGALNNVPTFTEIMAERALMRRLEGGCQIPIGALATTDDGQLALQGIIASLDGKRLIRDEIVGPADEAAAIGEELAERLLEAGGRSILAEIREGTGD